MKKLLSLLSVLAVIACASLSFAATDANDAANPVDANQPAQDSSVDSNAAPAATN